MTEDNNVADLNTELLHKIVRDLKEIREELAKKADASALAEMRAEMRGELAKKADADEVRAGFTQVRQEMADGFAAVHGRIDTLEKEAMLGFSAVRFELDTLKLERARRRPLGPTRPKRP